MINFDSHLLDRSKSYYLGFSGGVDSLAGLLFLLEGGFKVHPFHVRHFWNRRSSEIVSGVKRIYSELGVTGTIYESQARDIINPLEGDAYKIRNAVWDSHSYHNIILANHLNDLAEGYFINSMQGFPDRVPLKAVNGNKIRPFLRTHKRYFADYIERRGLTSLIVPDDMLSLRGKLRDTVFPALGNNWTAPAKKLFVDTGRIYEA